MPKDMQDWLKRLRRFFEGTSIRYFLVGEYGDHTERPHYHASLFGIGPADARFIADTWGKGFCYTAEFNDKTAQYVAAYVVKKMTAPDDVRLAGRHPEFARMSLKPGIGAEAMSVIAASIAKSDVAFKDAPFVLQMGKKKFPIGRYLRDRLRGQMDLPERLIEEAKKRFSLEKSEELLALFAAAQKDDEKALSLKEVYLGSNQGRLWSVEAKSKIRNGGML